MKSPDESNPRTIDIVQAKRKLLQERLSRRKRSSKSKEESSIQKRPAGQARQAALCQNPIWLQHQMDPRSSSNTVSSSFIIKSGLDLPLLQESVNRVVERHETLRSSYSLSGDQIEQKVDPDFRPKIEKIICQSWAEASDKAQASSLEPFDIETGPLLRIRLFIDSDKSILHLAVHDLIFDKWSLKQFWKEVSEFYEAKKEGRLAKVEELPIQYSDFAYWQRFQMESGAFNEQLDYWKNQLASPPKPIPLPTDFPYPSRITTEGRLERAAISSSLTRSLNRFAAENDVSASMLLHLAFFILLHRMTQAEDILISSPVANRRRKEMKGLIGFLLNTVIARLKFTPDLTVREALKEVRTRSLEFLENQDIPLDKVVETVAPEREPGRHPLVQTMFVFQREDEGLPKLELAGCDIEATFIHPLASKFDLTLFVAESGEEMETIAEYRTDLFTSESMRRFLARFQTVLENIIDHPEAKVMETGYLPKDELNELQGLGKGDQIEESEQNLVQLIANQCEVSPQATALSFELRQISYGELAAHSDALATRILTLNLPPQSRIGLYLEKSPEAITALLGILKSGNVYVPIDPQYPPNRKEYLFRNADTKVIITSQALSEDLDFGDRALIILEELDTSETNFVEVSIHLDDTAYVIYTSGSSGEPKGVAVSHRNALSSALARKQYYHGFPQRFLLLPSLSFDSSIAGIFWTLIGGGELVIPERIQHSDPKSLATLIRNRKVDTLLCVPTLYREIVEQENSYLKSLERAIVAGEPCPASLLERHFEALESVELHNEYGPTEASVWATVHRCAPSDAELESIPIGKPIPGTSIRLLDSFSCETPRGQEGEIHIGGEGVSQGYVGDEEKTSKSFVSIDGSRYYKTGDIAKWDENGRLLFCGRKDQQIKIRGYRIELGEIETALDRHPDVEQSIVLAVPDQASDFDWMEMIADAPNEVVQELLEEIEAKDGRANEENRTIRREHFSIDLKIVDPDFAKAPRRSQRDWLINQALAETADDLEHIDRISPHLVRGSEENPDQRLQDSGYERSGDDHIMEDWQKPIMRAMAEYAAGSHGDVLEIGFGRGISADHIQEIGVRSHTIIEMDESVVEEYYHPWRNRYPERDIRLAKGRWQHAITDLSDFDGIFFHTYPMNEKEFVEYILNSVTFAEHSFEPLSGHLRKGGAFTYFTGEIDSISRRHQRKLLKHFEEITFRVIDLEVPVDTKDAWWSHSIAVVKATK